MEAELDIEKAEIAVVDKLFALMLPDRVTWICEVCGQLEIVRILPLDSTGT